MVKHNFETWVSQSTIVKASDVDLNWLYPGEPYSKISQDWVDNFGVKLAIVTRADKGAFAYTSKVQVSMPARSIAVVDTLGSGDAFTAGMIKWLINNNKLNIKIFALNNQLEIDSALDLPIQLSGDTFRRERSEPPFLIDQES